MASPAAVLSILVQARGIAQTQAQLKRLNASADDTAKHTDQMASKFRGLNGTLGDFNRAMTSSRNAVTLVKWPAMIAGAGAATQAINALAAGAVGLGAAMAPLAGLGVAAGAGYAALGQGVGVAKLAFSGLEDAIKAGNAAMKGGTEEQKKYKEQLAKLTPAQAEFVFRIVEMGKELDRVKQIASQGLLPGLQQALKSVQVLFTPLERIVGETAKAMGGLARQAGILVASWKGDLLTVGRTNVKIIQNVGTAALSAADAARHLIVAAGPLTVWLSQLAVRGAEWVDTQVAAARESGKLAQFFQRTAAVVGRLIQISQNLGVAFLNIGKAAFPLGDTLLTDFTALTAKFREWTESASGKNQIAEFFARARPPLDAMFRLIRDVGKAFFALGEGGAGLAPLIDQLRTELLPALTGILQAGAGGGANFLSTLITTASQLLVAFTPLIGPSGPLTLFLQLVGKAAGVMIALQNTVPGVATAMTTLGGVMSVLSAVGMSKFISQTLGMRNGLAAVRGGVVATVAAYRALAAGQTAATVAQERGVAATLIAKTVTLAQAAATRVWAAAQAALNLVMRANPFILVATLLVALGAALVLAYQRSETFRNIVNGAFNAVKVVATAVFGFLRTYIVGVWNSIRSATTTIWGGIKTVVTTYLTAIRTLVTTYFTAYRTIITTAWNAIRTITTTVWNGIRTATVAVWNALKTAATTAWNGIRTAILTPIREARDTLNGIWSGIKGAASAAWDALKKGASDFAGGFKKIIVDAFKGAVSAVVGFLNAIIGAINLIPGVPNIKKIEDPTVDKKARGGAFARTGGMVNAPITLMGEEAPRYPEFVIPTNPAYRKRAQGLLGQAAGAIGFQVGGQWGQHLSKGQIMDLWTQAGGAKSQANLMAAIALAESGGWTRRPNATGSGAFGLWQILGSVVPGDLGDPLVNARNAVRKLQLQGLGAWEAYTNGSYKTYLGGGGGVSGALGAIGGAVSGAVGTLADAIQGGLSGLLGKLPGLDNLPDWLKGTGKYVLDKVTAWIKDKLSSPFGGDGGPDVEFGGDVGKAVKAMIAYGREMSSRGLPYVFGGGHGSWGPPFDCSGFVSAILHAGGLMSSPGDTTVLKGYGMPGPGKAVTIGVRGSSGRNAHTMIKVGNRYFESGGGGNGAHMRGGWNGSFDVYRHPGGFAAGGTFGGIDPFVARRVRNPEMLNVTDPHGPGFVGWGLRKGAQYGPYMGAYKNGGVLPDNGLYYGHKGETVIPYAQGGTPWTRGYLDIKAINKNAVWDPRTRQYVQKPMPTAWDLLSPEQKFIPATMGEDTGSGGDGGGGVDSSQIDELNGQISALNDTISQLNQKIELQQKQFADIQRNYNVSQSQYSVLAKAIADVANGEIGGRVGLGFMSPGFSGGGVRY